MDLGIDQLWRRVNLELKVVANALIAYCLFQAWGNDPERYDPLVSRISEELQKVSAASGDTKLGDYSDDFSSDIHRMNEWHFVAPTTPPALFLNTRTRRNYNHPSEPAELIRKGDYRLLKNILTSKRENQRQYLLGQPLIVVSPAPVPGPYFIEEKGQPIAQA